MTSYDADTFLLNPNLNCRLLRIGGDLPFIQIDDFYKHPEKVRDLAVSGYYKPDKSEYPGGLFPVDADDPGYVGLLKSISALMEQAFGTLLKSTVSIAAGEVDGDFAVTRLLSRDVTPGQANPHIDAVPLFGLVFLNLEPNGSTGFFRSKHTGRFYGGNRTLARELELVVDDPDQKGYLRGESRNWKEIFSVPSIYNRFICYPGIVFHTGYIDYVPDPFDITKARISQRIMFREVSWNLSGGE